LVRTDVFDYAEEIPMTEWDDSMWRKFAYDLEHIVELRAEQKRQENLKLLSEMKDKMVLDAKDIEVAMSCGKRQAYELMRSSTFPSFKWNSKHYVSKNKFLEWVDKQAGRELKI